MLDKNNPQIKMILQEFHKRVSERTGRYGRSPADIVRPNMVLQILCSDSRISPADCAEAMYERFGVGCTVDEMILIYRDYRINIRDKRKEVFGKARLVVDYLVKAMQGDADSCRRFKSFLNNREARDTGRYSRIVLAMAFQEIPALKYKDDQQAVLKLGDSMSRQLLYDLEIIIREVYARQERKQDNKKKAGPVERAKYEEILQKLAQTERALAQSNVLLDDLQSEFDERLEAVRVQEMSEFFGKLNSDRYGCILDELLTLRKGVETVRKRGYELPLEINGLLIMVKKLVQFLRDSHIDPMLRPGSVRSVKVADVEFWNYEGTPFLDNEEEKQVRVISPGWIYSEKQVQISRPKVKEVTEHD